MSDELSPKKIARITREIMKLFVGLDPDQALDILEGVSTAIEVMSEDTDTGSVITLNVPFSDSNY